MPDRHDELKVKIQAVYAEHRGWYGYRRITAAIRRDGRLVNHKTVQRLMSEMGMKSRVRVKKFRSYRGEHGQAALNVKWVTDVTEFSVAGKKLYLSPVMDLYNGEIIAYETSRRPDFSLVMNMLKKAARKCRGMDGPLLHSDQGWHYRMQPYSAALARYGMKQSMSRKGNCFDNAAMESFFGTMKAEYFHLSKFEDVEELNARLRRYIDYYSARLGCKGRQPEHGIVARRDGAHIDPAQFPVGSLLRVLPNHACATAAQHDRYHVINGPDTKIMVEWPRVRGY